MKKYLLLGINILIGTIMLSQTIVSTTTENKNVVLEEFTGIHCGYCPDGHARAKSIQDANPSDVVLINVHVGSYSAPSSGEPDFRTTFGSALANQSGLTGYPSGTVNRHVFNGVNIAMGRGEWAAAANTILAESSYVNVAVEAEIDMQTRVATIHVEAYYTGNSPVNTNKLNVAIMQNNTLGPQSGGGMGNNYVHMHRLVHLITGQWGEEITTTTQGTFVDKTYTYTIPADYNDVLAVIGDLEIAAFVAEGNKEIISGDVVEPTFTNFSENNNAGLDEIIVAEKICGTTVTPTIIIKNNGGDNLTSAEILFNVNDGADSVFLWTGNLSPFKTAEFELGDYEFDQQQTSTLNVEISSINNGTDEDLSDNTKSSTFDKSVDANNLITLSLTTDQYASETSWELYNSSGTLIESGGGYSNNTTNTEEFILDQDCYSFKLIDSYGDGGGPYSLTDSHGTTINESNGGYGLGETTPFKVVQTYKATITVTDGTDPIADAVVSLTGYNNQTTDDLGVAVFNYIIPETDIAYMVIANHYENGTGSISVVDEDVAEAIEMVVLPSYKVTFTVTHGTTAVANAEIDLTGYGKLSTDDSGVAAFNNVFSENDIAYSITTTGYEVYNNKVTVDGADIDVAAIIILTGINDIGDVAFSVYPNPTKSKLYIEYGEKIKNSILKVVNIKGEEILNKKLKGANITEIDMGKQAKGLYFIKIEGEGFTKTSKFILE